MKFWNYLMIKKKKMKLEGFPTDFNLWNYFHEGNKTKWCQELLKETMQNLF